MSKHSYHDLATIISPFHPETLQPHLTTPITNNSVSTPVGAPTPEDHPGGLRANTISCGTVIEFDTVTIHSILYLSFHLNQNKSLHKYIFPQRDDLILTCIFNRYLNLLEHRFLLIYHRRRMFL